MCGGIEYLRYALSSTDSNVHPPRPVYERFGRMVAVKMG